VGLGFSMIIYVKCPGVNMRLEFMYGV